MDTIDTVFIGGIICRGRVFTPVDGFSKNPRSGGGLCGSELEHPLTRLSDWLQILSFGHAFFERRSRCVWKLPWAGFVGTNVRKPLSIGRTTSERQRKSSASMEAGHAGRSLLFLVRGFFDASQKG
jgi:hypothetical protein